MAASERRLACAPSALRLFPPEGEGEGRGEFSPARNTDQRGDRHHIRHDLEQLIGNRRVHPLKTELEHAGFLGDFYDIINTISGLKDENHLDPQREYTYPEIVDRHLKQELGSDKGLDWLKEDGLWTDDKSVEEKYPRPFVSARPHIYYEFMKRAGEDVRQVTEEIGMPWETDDYKVLPDWKPGPAFHRKPPHDLYVINMKVPNHALSHTAQESAAALDLRVAQRFAIDMDQLEDGGRARHCGQRFGRDRDGSGKTIDSRRARHRACPP